MPRRAILQILLWLGIAAIIGGIVLIRSRPAEPRYNGKGIREWTAELSYGNPEQSEQAKAAIKTVGPSAVPYLIGMLEKEDSVLDMWLRKMSGNSLSLGGQPSYSHAIAATALRELGSEAQSAIPALEKVAGQRDHLASYKARAALMVIRNEPVAALAKTLGDRRQENWSNWVMAATLGSELGGRARPLIPLFIAAFDDTNSRIRFKAISALGSIALEPDACVPVILKGLRDTERIVRYESLSALHRFPSAIIRAQKDIQRCLGDTDNTTRAMAVITLSHGVVSLDSNWVTQAVQPLLNDPDQTVRDLVANLLRELQKPSR